MAARPLTLVVLALAASCAGDERAAVRAEDAWSRPTVAGAEHAEVSEAGELGPGVAYFTLVNEGAGPDRLRGVASDVCRVVELHRTETDGERARMVPVADGVELPAGATVAFEPGGLHAMLVGLYRDLVPGERFELVLAFERAGELAVECEVRPHGR